MEQTQTTSNNITQQINTAIDFKRILGEVLNKWYWFVLALFLFLLAGFLYLRYTTPIYSAESHVMIETDKSSAASVLIKKGGMDNTSNSDMNLFNEMLLLKSQDLSFAVADSLDMNIRYYAQGRVREDEIYKTSPIKVIFDEKGYLGGSSFEMFFKGVSTHSFELHEAIAQEYPYNTWIDRPYGRFRVIKSSNKEANFGYLEEHTGIIIRIAPLKDASKEVLSKFSVDIADGRTSVLRLYITDNIPQRGVDFLQTLIYFYRAKELQNLNLSAEKRRDMIERYKKEFTRDLKSQDSIAAEIQLQTDLVDIAAQKENVITRKTTSRQRIEQLELQKTSVKNVKNNILYGVGQREEVIAGVGVEDEYLNSLIASYNELIQRKATIERNTAPLNTMLVKVRDEIDAKRKQIADACDLILQSINTSIQNAASNIIESNKIMQKLPEAEIDLAESKREYPVLNELYLFIYQKGVENDIEQYATTNKSKVIVAPYASSVPIKPISKNIYTMMFALGLLLPGTIIIGKVLLNNKVINENDIKSLTAIPILGAIARIKDNKYNNNVVVGSNIRTPISEQFRLIRANLEFMSVSGNKKVYLITSSMSGEGKTFISLNLGLTMTLAKKRVVVMELDLRRPKLSNYLGLKTTGGISGYLAGIAGIESVIKPSGIHENLYIANCGPIPPNPGELLVLPSTKQLIEELSEMFDIIIMDTAPIGLVSDALVLSPFSDVNMFVVRQSYTLKEQIKLFNTLYKEGKINNASIIFNGVEYLKKYGYGTDYGYGGSYGYGYYNDDEKKATKRKSLFEILFKK